MSNRTTSHPFHSPEALTVEDIRQRPTLTVAEAARALGISEDTAYAAIKDGSLPVLRLGRRLLVKGPRLAALLEGE